MRKGLAFIVACMMGFSSITAGFAEAFSDKGYYDFEGTIGEKTKIVMSLYVNEGTGKGTYCYDSVRTDIKIEGTVKDNQFSLKEYDNKGNVTATFKGTYKTVDAVTGEWKSAKTGKKMPFKLQLNSMAPFAEYGHRYAVMGAATDKEVDTYIQSLQGWLVKGDAKKVAEQIAFPIKVTIKGKAVQIKTQKDFVKRYKEIMNPEFKKEITTAYTKGLFTNYQGVMFGGNAKNIWITVVTDQKGHASLRIIGINN